MLTEVKGMFADDGKGYEILVLKDDQGSHYIVRVVKENPIEFNFISIRPSIPTRLQITDLVLEFPIEDCKLYQEKDLDKDRVNPCRILKFLQSRKKQDPPQEKQLTRFQLIGRELCQ